MAKKRFSPEQVVAKLRQIEVLTAAGKKRDSLLIRLKVG